MDPMNMAFIILWAGRRIPVNYLPCQGQLLKIQDYQALYALLGTTYGGDGRTTFALPNLSSRIPIGSGAGPGLTNRAIASTGGTEGVTLSTNNMPLHTHAIQGLSLTAGGVTASLPTPTKMTASLKVNANIGSSRQPSSGLSFAQAPDTSAFGDADTIYGPPNNAAPGMPVTATVAGGQTVNVPGITLNVNGSSASTGGNNNVTLPHENRQQFVALQYLICTLGVYPTQS